MFNTFKDDSTEQNCSGVPASSFFEFTSSGLVVMSTEEFETLKNLGNRDVQEYLGTIFPHLRKSPPTFKLGDKIMYLNKGKTEVLTIIQGMSTGRVGLINDRYQMVTFFQTVGNTDSITEDELFCLESVGTEKPFLNSSNYAQFTK
jgi:hypothetical protein